MDKHTPRPWSVRYDFVVQAASFEVGRLVPVAQPYGVNTDGTDLFANARLIAAAPELLEAAEIALSYIEAVCFNTPNEKKRRNYADAASKIRAAIAKARGDDNQVECQACYGKGFNDVERQVAERKSDVQTFRETCDACEGTGKVSAGGVA